MGSGGKWVRGAVVLCGDQVGACRIRPQGGRFRRIGGQAVPNPADGGNVYGITLGQDEGRVRPFRRGVQENRVTVGVSSLTHLGVARRMSAAQPEQSEESQKRQEAASHP